MAIYNKESKLCDVILSDPTVIQVINRFGVSLGVGDLSIRKICEIHGIDEYLFLAIINTYLNGNYFPEEIVGRIRLQGLVEYLEKTDLYYRNTLLPNVERHFSLLISKSTENGVSSNLNLLRGFFGEVKEEMLAVINSDLNLYFPIMEGEDSNSYGSSDDVMAQISMTFDNHALEDKLEDLINFFVIHLKGKYDQNLCVAVVTALVTLKKDVHQNNRIRNRLLKPLCQELYS